MLWAILGVFERGNCAKIQSEISETRNTRNEIQSERVLSRKQSKIANEPVLARVHSVVYFLLWTFHFDNWQRPFTAGQKFFHKNFRQSVKRFKRLSCTISCIVLQYTRALNATGPFLTVPA